MSVYYFLSLIALIAVWLWLSWLQECTRNTRLKRLTLEALDACVEEIATGKRTNLLVAVRLIMEAERDMKRGNESTRIEYLKLRLDAIYEEIQQPQTTPILSTELGETDPYG